MGPRGIGPRGMWGPDAWGWPFRDLAAGRDPFGPDRGPRHRRGRGDVRNAVLALLAEEPMHGYQIIHEIEERSGGFWRPSPGSVYPTLQMLVDEGLVTAQADGEKKTYTLTDEGREAAPDDDDPRPWDGPQSERPRGPESLGALPKAGMRLAQAASQFGPGTSPEQIERAIEVLDDARRKLYSILAEG